MVTSQMNLWMLGPFSPRLTDPETLLTNLHLFHMGKTSSLCAHMCTHTQEHATEKENVSYVSAT
jgi:hypothetical protein